jgi:hypothetical protein
MTPREVLRLQPMIGNQATGKMTTRAVDRPLIQALDSRPTWALQRYPTEDGDLEATEKPELTNFLAHNFEPPHHYTTADYKHMGELYAELLAEEETATSAEDLEPAWSALYDYADDNRLEDPNPKWTAAVEAGAENYEGNQAAGFAAVAEAVWPGQNAHPDAFETAIADQVQAREAERRRKIEATYQAYAEDGRLLPGTINKIKEALPDDADLATVSERLQVVYQRQCVVSRANWLQHLGIQGANMKGTSKPDLHYTTYNDSIPNPLPADLRVDNKTTAELLDALFGAVEQNKQIHATRQIGPTRYRHYYDGTFTPNNPGDEKLDQEFDLMMTHMQKGVENAIKAHGRVGNNAQAKQLTFGP